MDYLEIADATYPAARNSELRSLAMCSVTDHADATAGKNGELTIAEVLEDPLIAIVMKADGVTSEEFQRLLETAAREMEAKLANSTKEGETERATGTPLPSDQCEDTQRVCRNDTKDG